MGGKNRERLTKQRPLDQEAGEGEGAGDRGKDARSIAFNLYSLRVKANEAPELRFFIVQPGCMQRLY